MKCRYHETDKFSGVKLRVG